MAFSLDERVRSTYFSLRIGVAILGLIFPLLLWVGGKRAGFPLEPSMSAYYHATAAAPDEPVAPCKTGSASTVQEAGTMRDWFVGILFAVGAMLYVNKGFSDKENLALNIAGLMAVGIALFPMSWSCSASGWFSMHGACAVAFFLCIAFVCEFCSEETVKYLDNDDLKAKFRTRYKALAITMLVSPLLAVAINLFSRHVSHLLFWIEAFGIWSFATFWLVKSHEIRIISRQVVHGPVAPAAPAKLAA